jgi:hypothetical protein
MGYGLWAMGDGGRVDLKQQCILVAKEAQVQREGVGWRNSLLYS